MICRIWRGRTSRENAPVYENLLRTEVMPEIVARRIEGFRGFDIMKRRYEDGYEFVTVMWFDDVDAVKRFVGEDYETAHVPQKARDVLSWFDARSRHYDVLEQARS